MSLASPGRRARFRPSHDNAPTEPFAPAVDAWFWHMTCHRAKLDGARVAAGMPSVSRPCEPGDIHRIVSRLYRARRLRPHHLRVLVHYGQMMLTPDSACSNGRRDVRDWHEALAHLDQALRARGIVA